MDIRKSKNQHRYTNWIKGIFTGVLLALFALANVQAQEVVVTSNGGFEDSNVGDTDTLNVANWQMLTGSDADADFFITDTEVHSGDRALRVAIDTLGANAWNIQAVHVPFDVIPDYEHTYKVWLKASSAGTRANITVGRPDYSGEYGRSSATLSTEWTEYTFDFFVPAGDSAGRAPIHFNFEENLGDTVWVDDFSISYQKIVGEPLVVEAESGTAGSEWATETDSEDGNSYVAITTDQSGSVESPGENRTISYELTFPDTGSYDLFARVYVGEDSTHDDSWFAPRGFGAKDAASAGDWTAIDGLAEAGFNVPGSIVRNAGTLGSGVWKWVNLSKNSYQTTPADTFMISDPDSLTRTFELGAREDGLRIDKIAFGLSDYYYTVENLNNAEAGSELPPVEPQDPMAEGKVKWLGNNYRSVANPAEYFTYYWNQVTPGNAGKWGSVERTRDEMDWEDLDGAYALAKDNGYPFRYHVLIWGNQQPGWINDLSEEEQLEEIGEWMDAVAERYPDIDYLEVANETLPGHNPPNGVDSNADYATALGGSGETGYDWVIKAFEMARERFPDTPLMINDYGIVGSINNRDRYIELIELLQERDLIDAIGVQAHAFSTRGSAEEMRTTLDMLAETGLPIQATEMDIDGDPSGTDAESDQKQLEDIQRIFPTFWEHPSVMGVTFWGWQPGLWRDEYDAFLMRDSGQERPALEWLRAYVDTAQVELNVSNERAEELPSAFSLSHNYPNPFNPTTNIRYTVPQATDVTIKVYDLTGRLVQTLVNGRQTAGAHTVSFNASRLASGVYFYRLEAGSFTDVKRMMLIK